MGLVYQPSTESGFIFDKYQREGDNKGQEKGYGFFRQDGQYNLQYPINLDTSGDSDDELEFGKQRVVFFINVPANSKTLIGGSNDFRNVGVDIPPNEFRKLLGLQKLANEMLIENPENAATKALAAVANSARMKRLIACICLYVPNSLNLTYGTMWQEEDMTSGAFIDRGLDIVGEAILNTVGLNKESSGKGIFELLKSAGGDGIGLVGSAIGLGVLGGSLYLQKATRMTGGNSKAEQLFRGVDFRLFSYDYDFAPRLEAEAAAVLDIIRMFRHHMLPEFADDSQFIYVYPLEFDIKYYTGDTENPHLEKHMTAVLTNCSINYTPNGQFNTFANGMPTHIRMQLQFKELGTPSKESSPYNDSGV